MRGSKVKFSRKVAFQYSGPMARDWFIRRGLTTKQYNQAQRFPARMAARRRGLARVAILPNIWKKVGSMARGIGDAFWGGYAARIARWANETAKKANEKKAA